MNAHRIASAGAVVLMSVAALAGPAVAQPGNGGAVGRPADGTVGNAQVNPRQTDYFGDPPNNGWRCDKNKGIGQGNPAHASDCEGDEEIPQ